VSSRSVASQRRGLTRQAAITGDFPLVVALAAINSLVSNSQFKEALAFCVTNSSRARYPVPRAYA
jgi:hypothetical protein